MIFQNGKTERHGAVMAGIMAAVREVVQEALQQLCNGGGEDGSQQQDDAVASLHAALSELMQINAGLLEAMGVGHAALRRVYDIAAEHGAAAKLTGAGGGGCALLLLPLGPDRAAEVRISSALHALGYTTVGLQLGSGGVRAETS